jgi:hypothetical protein
MVSILKAYGAWIWLGQILFYIAARWLNGWFFLKPGRAQNSLAELTLSIAFAWNGGLFFSKFAKDMSGDRYGNSYWGPQRKEGK